MRLLLSNFIRYDLSVYTFVLGEYNSIYEVYVVVDSIVLYRLFDIHMFESVVII